MHSLAMIRKYYVDNALKFNQITSFYLQRHSSGSNIILFTTLGPQCVLHAQFSTAF